MMQQLIPIHPNLRLPGMPSLISILSFLPCAFGRSTHSHSDALPKPSTDAFALHQNLSTWSAQPLVSKMETALLVIFGILTLVGLSLPTRKNFVSTLRKHFLRVLILLLRNLPPSLFLATRLFLAFCLNLKLSLRLFVNKLLHMIRLSLALLFLARKFGLSASPTRINPERMPVESFLVLPSLSNTALEPLKAMSRFGGSVQNLAVFLRAPGLCFRRSSLLSTLTAHLQRPLPKESTIPRILTLKRHLQSLLWLEKPSLSISV